MLCQNPAKREKISCKKTSEAIIRANFSKILSDNNLNLTRLEKDEITKYDIKLKATIITTRPGIIENIVSNISSNPDIIAISWDHKKYISSDNEDIEEELEEDS